MIKLTHSVLISTIFAGLLIGCGSSDSDTTVNTNDDTTTVPENSLFGANVMPILIDKCQSCHGSNGSFTITTASNTYANIVSLKGSASAGGQYLLDKGSNTIEHGGGMVITTTSNEYTTIKSWVDAGAANN